MSSSLRRLRFAVVNETPGDSAWWFDHVRRIEGSGIDTLLVRDHLATEAFGPQPAPMAALAAAAAVTTRLRVGTMVLGNDFRHPAILAHEAATIDWLSGGRFELGLGAGWMRAEYERLGLAFDPPGARIARLEEAVSIICALLAGETVTFHGTHYTIDELALPTRPVQRPRPPLLLGGGGLRMLALAARHADIVGILPAPIRGDDDPDDPAARGPAALDAKLDVIRASAGERFDELELSIFATFVVTGRRRSETEALIAREGWSGVTCEDVWQMPSVFVGTPEQIAEDLRFRRERFGITYFVTTDRAVGEVGRIVERFGR